MISKHFKTLNFLNKFVWVTWSALQSSNFNSRWTMLGIHTHRQGIEKKGIKNASGWFWQQWTSLWAGSSL